MIFPGTFLSHQATSQHQSETAQCFSSAYKGPGSREEETSLTRQAEEERANKMFVLVVLLISPAFGRSIDFGADVVNQLSSVVNFNEDTKKIIDENRLFAI